MKQPKVILKGSIFFLLFFILHFSTSKVNAQDDQLSEPVYIVKPGDTLWAISRTFNVPIDDLAERNLLSDPAQIAVGSKLVVPGYEGLQGVLVVLSVPFGENLESISRTYHVPVKDLVRLNRWTTPDNAAAGSNLVTLDRGEELDETTSARRILKAGISIFELAIAEKTNQWIVKSMNNLEGIRGVLPGRVYHVPGDKGSAPGALPEVVDSIEFVPPTLSQGKTFQLQIGSSKELSLEGSVGEFPLNFFPFDKGYTAFQGIHALQEPGFYQVTIVGDLNTATHFEFSQHVYVKDGGYSYDPPLVVNSETIDVEITKPEDFEWFSIVEPVNEHRLWSGVFLAPVPDDLKECHPSLFGSRRSYNGSAYDYFHTGLDFCGSTGVDIYAPAAGRVVFANFLIVRGNATVIDHGWGVYTAYAHQSEIFVSVGDYVEPGQLIGRIGSSGRVTGPHLHWEVIVGGVQVDPMDWLKVEYP